jgi:alpha-N-arabinofuranosidase
MRDLMMRAFGVRGFVYACIWSIAAGVALQAAEFHVATTGNDANPGTAAAPLRTIQRGAELAQPGDVVTVHAGVYRERVNPPRGGESDAKRITYQAAPGEKVEIKGSEVVKGWEKGSNDTWKVTLPNTFFGSFNPYDEVLAGDWYEGRGGRHIGTVYLEGNWIEEAQALNDVLAPVGRKPLWKAEVGGTHTTIWAQFKGTDPNAGEVEINVRKCIFYPAQPGRNYITVRGFVMRNAATPWAGAMSEQVGLIGTHWSKGWIIESNTISHSICAGVTLGRYELPAGTKPPATAPGFVKSIEYALRDGWSRDKIGGHIVRNNHISHCERNAIHGSLGGIFSTITGNTIHDIAVLGWAAGPESAGIKLLGSQDVLISGNNIYRCNRGIWLDWMAQGVRVSGNLLYDNACDLFLEVNHGPYLVDNNLFLSPTQQIKDWSHGGAFVHNLFRGKIVVEVHPRVTPYHLAHDTKIAGLAAGSGGDNRFFNNLFVVIGQLFYDKYDIRTGGNIFYEGARRYVRETNYLDRSGFKLNPKIEQKDGNVLFHMQVDAPLSHPGTALVTTELLGKTKVSQLGFENPDGSPLKIDTDYFGKPRDPKHPSAGPFENPGAGELILKVW